MDPYVVYDCQRVVPNQFALTLAAAARWRALNHGAEPRLVPSAGTGNAYLALQEIAAGVFGNTELARAVGGPNAGAFLAQPASTQSLLAASDAAAPRLPSRETIH